MDKPDLSAYYEECLAISLQGDLSLFRSNPAIRRVTDTNTLEHGLECERTIMQDYRHILPWLPRFQHLDAIGMPPLYQFRHVGLFNPTTLRHILTLCRIEELYGTDIHRVVEIGGSYGMLASLLYLTDGIQAYEMYEPRQVYELARLFISPWSTLLQLGFNEPGNKLNPGSVFDVAISCYALSELDRDQQDWYIDNVLINARAGFLVMNSCSNGYPRLEMIQRLEAKLEIQVICEREIPLTHKDNYTLMWKRGNDGQ